MLVNWVGATKTACRVERNNLVLERFREREEKTTGLETQRLANLQILNRNRHCIN